MAASALLAAACLASSAIPLPLRLPGLRGRRSEQTHGSAAVLRRRLHVNPLITEPGTAEVEWSHSFGAEGSYAMPTTLKFTPEGAHVYWGRTEFNAGMDLLTVSSPDGSRVARLGDRVSVGANLLLYDGEHLDLALLPQSTFLLHDDRGARLGGTLIARYDAGLSSAGLQATWTGATAPSPTNPAATLDLDGGFGRRLRSRGVFHRFTLHGDVLWEKPAATAAQISLFEGLECEFSQSIAVDVTFQHFNVAGEPHDHAVVFGLTINLGRVRQWFRRASRPGGSG